MIVFRLLISDFHKNCRILLFLALVSCHACLHLKELKSLTDKALKHLD